MNWKSPPEDNTKLWLSKSLELCVMLACDWRCASCNSYSQFPTIGFIRKGTMTLGMIEHFIAEMRATNSYLGRIRILGGEPTLWPLLPKAVKLLHEELIVTGHLGRLEIISNGGDGSPEYAAKVQAVKPWIAKVRISGEADKQKHHTASMVQTPLSLGYEGRPCSQPYHCGIQLSAYGYFPCSAGAGLAKLRDLQQYQRLAIPVGDSFPYPRRQPTTVNRTWPDLSQLCGHCMHALKPEHKIKCGTGMQPGQHELSTPNAEVWSHLAPHLAGKQLDWEFYGQHQPVPHAVS